MQLIQIIPKPMEFTAMDVNELLPGTAKGNKYILVFSDYHARSRPHRPQMDGLVEPFNVD